MVYTLSHLKTLKYKTISLAIHVIEMESVVPSIVKITSVKTTESYLAT